MRRKTKLDKGIEAVRKGSDCALDDSDPLDGAPAVKITRRKKSPRKKPARRAVQAKAKRK